MGLKSLCGGAEQDESDAVCCNGTFSQSCGPTNWSTDEQNIYKAMKDICPNSVLYKRDKPASVFKCRGKSGSTSPDYMITIGWFFLWFMDMDVLVIWSWAGIYYHWNLLLYHIYLGRIHMINSNWIQDCQITSDKYGSFIKKYGIYKTIF